MILSFHPCIDAHAQVILGVRTLDSSDLKWVRKADAIILPQTCPQDLYEACSGSGALVFPNYETRFKYPGKIGQSLLFGDLDLPHPETFCWGTVKDFEEAYPGWDPLPHTLPFFVKDDMSHEAEAVFLVEGRTSLIDALDHLALRERSGLYGFVSQAYIPCDANVLRTVIMGKRVITYWKRPNKQGQVITTISRGAIIDNDWRPDLQEKGKAHAMALAEGTGINLAAIDFLFPLSDKDPEPLFLEINYYFGRRGLGGIERYYSLLFEAVRGWLEDAGIDPGAIRLV